MFNLHTFLQFLVFQRFHSWHALIFYFSVDMDFIFFILSDFIEHIIVVKHSSIFINIWKIVFFWVVFFNIFIIGLFKWDSLAFLGSRPNVVMFKIDTGVKNFFTGIWCFHLCDILWSKIVKII